MPHRPPRLLPRLLLGLALLTPASLAVAQPATQPSTRPGQVQPGERREQIRRGRHRMDRLFHRIIEAAGRFDPSAEQASQIKAAVEAAHGDLRKLAPGWRSLEPRERRAEHQAFFESVVDEVAGHLDQADREPFKEEASRRLRERRPASRPTSRPDRDARPEQGAQADDAEAGAGRGRLRAFEKAVAELDLDEDRRAKVDAVMAEFKAQLRDVARAHRDDPEKLREEVQAEVARFRQKLSAELTPRQRAALRKAVRPNRGQDADEPRPRRQGGVMGQMNRGDFGELAGGAGFGSSAPAEAGPPPAPTSRFLDRLRDPPGLAVGGPLPEGLNVLNLTGDAVPLRSLLAENRPTLVLLGSATSPTFRDRVGDLPWLRDQLRDAGTRAADLVVVYTREQYPAGDWTPDRNLIDGFDLPAHGSADDRVETAKNLRAWGDITGLGVTVAADAMDDAALSALAGGPSAVGNFAFVFRPDGTLVARQRWFDPTAVPALVAAAADPQ